jgi:predicted DNA-binding protein (UPF0251 family)/predicted Fe-Mo cluster-binding NifX family protein
VFKPAGVPTRQLEEVVLSLDGFEAIRLVDLEGLYHEQAAERMRVSRATFGRILDSARRDVAQALIHGKVLRIEGGPVYTEHPQPCGCGACAADREMHEQTRCRHNTCAGGRRSSTGELKGEVVMYVCVPVEEDKGLQSPVCGHFGSAPAFVIVDTTANTCRAIVNTNQHHGHGMCAPLAVLAGVQIDAMIVGGIGMGAFNKLSAAGIRVYVSDKPTVAEAVTALQAGSLPLMQPGMACAGHGHPHP